MVDERRQNDDLADVRHADTELPPRVRRVERGAGSEYLHQPVDRRHHFGVDPLRVRRRLHAARRATEQPVAEMAAQLVERDARIGLSHIEPFGSTRHALRPVNLDEDVQPFEVQFRHGDHYLKTIWQLYQNMSLRNRYPHANWRHYI